MLAVGTAQNVADNWIRSKKRSNEMFKSLEEMMRFSETARQAAVKSIARLTVAASIAAIWIQGFFYAFLPAE